jgi:hypothetical protein
MGQPFQRVRSIPPLPSTFPRCICDEKKIKKQEFFNRKKLKKHEKIYINLQIAEKWI